MAFEAFEEGVRDERVVAVVEGVPGNGGDIAKGSDDARIGHRVTVRLEGGCSLRHA